MNRPTVNDVARTAGVSLATVDRVLNTRPGVREATIRRVNKAIEELGYVRDVAAANLARRRNYRFAFVLTEGASQFLAALRDAIAEVASTSIIERTQIEEILVPAGDPHALVSVLENLKQDGIDGVALMAPETPHVRDAIRRLKDAGVSVASVISDLPNTGRDHFVGVDNIAAGRTAGVLMGRFLAGHRGKILVAANSMQLRESIERRLGFDEVLQKGFADISVLPSVEWHEDPGAMSEVVADAILMNPDVIGVYSLGTGNRLLTRALAPFRTRHDLVVIAHELTPHTRNALEDGSIDAIITQNVGHVVRSTLRVLRAKTDDTDLISSQEKIRIDIVLRENLI